MPRLWKKWPRRGPSGAEPETAYLTLPPIACTELAVDEPVEQRELDLQAERDPCRPPSRIEWSTAVSAAARKILPLPPASAFCSDEL